jgi:hypothetical protein
MADGHVEKEEILGKINFINILSRKFAIDSSGMSQALPKLLQKRKKLGMTLILNFNNKKFGKNRKTFHKTQEQIEVFMKQWKKELKILS